MEEKKPFHQGTANLKPIKPGECRNPKGRPKGSKNLTSTLVKLLQRKMPTQDPVTKKTVNRPISEAVIVALVGRALKGEVRAIEQIIDRVEGKVPQAMFGDFGLSKSDENSVYNYNDPETRELLKKLYERKIAVENE